VIREMNVGQDSEFSLELFMSRYNSDLANDLGNLVSRALNMIGRYCDRTMPEATVEEDPEKELQALWEKTRKEAIDHYEGLQFHAALDRTFTFVRAINRYVELRAPWKLAKSQEAESRALLATSLATIGESLRLSATLLSPVMPAVAARILELVGAGEAEDFAGELEWSKRLAGRGVSDPVILFPRPPKEEA
jgi:methionyl-tRNA synthetase